MTTSDKKVLSASLGFKYVSVKLNFQDSAKWKN